MQLKTSWPALIGLQLVVLVVCCGCPALSSIHPASQLAQSESIPEYLLGTWDVLEFLGISGEEVATREVVISRGPDGSLTFSFTQGAASVEGTASLATLQGETILSILSGGPEESWLLARLSFDEEQQVLEVTSLSHPEVVRDIDLGLVEGEVFRFHASELAKLTASTDELRAYLSAHQDIFGENLIVLRKRTP